MANDAGEPRHVRHTEVLTPEEYRSGRRSTGNARQNVGPTASGPFLWTYTSASGCAPAAVSLVIFFVLWAQYSLLAGLGFAVIHLLGNALGVYLQARKLVLGLPFNLWGWRVLNWLVSIFITMWLAS